MNGLGGLEEMMASGDNLDFGASGEEGLGGDDEDLLMLQKAVQNALDKKKQAVVKKQAAVLEEARAGAQKRVAALEAMIAKELKDAAAGVRSTASSSLRRLDAKMTAMNELSAKYQQTMSDLWNEYDSEFSELGSALEKHKTAVENRRQGIKRKIAQVAQENEAALAEARKKVEAEKGRAVKMPQLAKLLQSLM
ncbi:hypothetical protein HXX76_011270 [Chlamydomonas incerta]|uniref:Uncharacterized protein n=1 Tax=Chlamydomonas incerta TaxID=51695 RepID=A0A835VX19_CHLIN|nr:hypothetical protein HXX76_011270 [Chlamydomonas incerta]|eukprot:KAG2429028.1 hypothetical protein HXX76_011270 [Chlamydomonas incerta]